MFKSVFGFDWTKSKPHLLFLSRFVHPTRIEELSTRDEWKAVLKELPQKAIERFIREGLLTFADLSGKLDYKFKVTELKPMLKSRGLPVSGRKEELISRLIQADPKGMEKEVVGLNICICTEKGMSIAKDFIDSERANREQVEAKVFELLQQRKFKEASIAVANFEANQVFPRGIGIDWSKHNPSKDATALMQIFTQKPKILNRTKENALDVFRLAAGMMYLWGVSDCWKWLPENLETDLFMKNEVAVRMLLFSGYGKASLQSYRANSDVVKGVKILAREDSCPECKKVSGILFPLDNPPELPYEHCTHENGCRCCYIPISIGSDK